MRRLRSSGVAVTYALFALAWIVFSDSVLKALGLSSEEIVTYSLAKGFVFVFVTAVALYILTYRFALTTERREAEYRELFEHNPNPMWFYDLKTLAFLKVNDAAVSKYGYTPEEFAQMKITDIRPPEDHDRLHANVEAVRSGAVPEVNESGAWQHLTKDGRLLWVDVTSHVTEFDGRKAEAVLIRDLTEAHAARQELFRLQQESVRRRDIERFGQQRA